MSYLPSISIVTPAFNAVTTIDMTIRSVVDQNYQNLEYILIDGGSNDGTVDVIQGYQKHFNHWCSEPDEGQYSAINKGFARSSGEIMGWLNADDMFLPRSLQIIGEVFQQFPEVQWVSTLKPGIWDANGQFEGIYPIPGFSKAAFLDGLYLPGIRTKGNWIQQESTFWRRRLWEKAGSSIPLQYPLAGDFALWSEFFRHTELYGIDYPISGFRTIEGQRSEDIYSYSAEAGKALTVLRHDNNWRRDLSADIIYSKLTKLPKLTKYITETFGYTGNSITKINRRQIDSGWSISKRMFIP